MPQNDYTNFVIFLEKQKHNSPYSAESWDELQTENNRLRTELAILRKEREQLVKIHEACASELWDAKQKLLSLRGFAEIMEKTKFEKMIDGRAADVFIRNTMRLCKLLDENDNLTTSS